MKDGKVVRNDLSPNRKKEDLCQLCLRTFFSVVLVPSLQQRSHRMILRASRQPHLPAPEVVSLNAPGGMVLKATYFAAGKPGPGVILFHQSNRTRHSWDDVAMQLASAGINILAIDDPRLWRKRRQKRSRERSTRTAIWAAAFEYLVSQPGVTRAVIGAGGAGWLGVDDSVEMARQHPGQVKSLVLLSGETLGGTLARIGYEFPA